MAAASEGDKVKVHYTGTLNDGTVFDSSRQREPIEFQIGEGQVIPGFEQAVVGMNPGETKTATIEAANAYGQRRDEMTSVVPRAQLPEDLQPEVGQMLQAQGPQGQVIPVRVTEVSEETVTIDTNHPLAGQDLTFEIELVEVS